MALVPSSPSKLSSILLWNASGATLMPKGILFHFILPTGVLKVVSREPGSSSAWDMPESRLDISQGKHFGIANFCKQMINSWYWILIALECSVQRSGIYAKSYSILSRRLVDNGGSTHPVSGLSYVFKNALFLKILDFCNFF